MLKILLSDYSKEKISLIQNFLVKEYSYNLQWLNGDTENIYITKSTPNEDFSLNEINNIGFIFNNFPVDIILNQNEIIEKLKLNDITLLRPLSEIVLFNNYSGHSSDSIKLKQDDYDYSLKKLNDIHNEQVFLREQLISYENFKKNLINRSK